MKLVFISDTHTKHQQLTPHIQSGDLIICGGDFMSSGKFEKQATDFLDWFNDLDFKHKIYIAGNHDVLFELPGVVKYMKTKYPDLIYLEDSGIRINESLIWGSPWQPRFFDWAFNIDRNSQELKSKWDMIPTNTDILVTHSPPQGHLDTSGPPWNEPNLGCELLRDRIDTIKPKIHIFGHIHGSYGYKFNGYTHFINASVLNEQYNYVNKPIHVEWNSITNQIQFL